MQRQRRGASTRKGTPEAPESQGRGGQQIHSADALMLDFKQNSVPVNFSCLNRPAQDALSQQP